MNLESLFTSSSPQGKPSALLNEFIASRSSMLSQRPSMPPVDITMSTSREPYEGMFGTSNVSFLENPLDGSSLPTASMLVDSNLFDDEIEIVRKNDSRYSNQDPKAVD